ncbi:MAG: DUF2911 domain-containing protein [Saprospiraceae bacterium]|nr:DUF2911 domain-containing protein [Saprospiraceae bacterium]
MKYSFLSLLFILFTISLVAQEIEFPVLDKSPMDAAHYPRSSAFANYLDADDPNKAQKIKVLYSKPYKNERTVFGELQKFGEEWRLGANEGTEITFYQNVEIGGTTINRGTYGMFADLYADHWVVKFSSQRHTAGTANRDKSKDVAHVVVMTSTTKDVREQFTIGFQKVDEGNVNMIMEWDRTKVVLPINLNAPSMDGEDASPMDLAAYPSRSRFQNFLKPEEVEANQPQIRVLYSRPQMKGRKIFGELLKYGEMWRVGANQTTTITFFNDVTIGGKDLKAGTYGLFAKVNEKDWEFIIHKNTQSWGNANHDEADNIVSVKAMTAKTSKSLEALSITFDKKSDKQVDIVIGWEDTMASLPVTMK